MGRKISKQAMVASLQADIEKTSVASAPQAWASEALLQFLLEE